MMTKHRVPHSRFAALAALLLLPLSACSGSGEAQETADGGAPPATPVETVNPEQGDVDLTATLTGRAVPYEIAEIRPQVSGLIRERLFDEGDMVEAGEPLYQIEDTEYRAAVNSAAASLERAQATAKTALATAGRLERLVEINAVSRQQYDEASAAAAQAEADIAMQRAALEQARVNLERTTVKAPISGRIGRSSVTAGALVTQNQAQALATVRQLDPIYVDLTASAADILRWKRGVADGTVASNANDEVPVLITLEDGIDYDQQGRLALTEVSVDENAGTVVLRAVVPNAEDIILPGMFVRASLPIGQLEDALLVPQAAVMRTPRGEPYVYTVSADNTAEQRLLTVRGDRGGDWIVTGGLEPQENVITTGLQMLRPGAPVAMANGETQPPQGGPAAAGGAGR